MKKLLLGCLLAACMCTGLYADSAEDAQFQEFYSKLKQDAVEMEGVSLLADKNYRIIFLVMPYPVTKADLTNEKINDDRATFIKSIRDDKDECKAVKSLKIRFVVSYITSDKDIVSFAVSFKDL